MSKHKKRIFIGITIVFIAFLFYISLNRIVVQFLNEEMQLHKIDFDDYNYDTHVYFYMNPFEYEDNNIFEIVSCTGWAFIPSKDNSADKRTSIILKGRKNSYITADCGGVYDDIHNRLKGWKDIPGNNNQFYARFSTVNLPDDIYDIYIYVEEGEEIKGISPTNYAFEKKGIHLYGYVPRCAVCADLDVSQIEENIDNGWMTVTGDTGYVQVSGWATVDLVPCEDAEYYVLFEGNNGERVAFETIKLCRTDVVQELDKNTLYTESGYCCGVGKDELPDDNGKVYLIMKYENKYYKSDAQEFNR